MKTFVLALHIHVQVQHLSRLSVECFDENVNDMFTFHVPSCDEKPMSDGNCCNCFEKDSQLGGMETVKATG